MRERSAVRKCGAVSGLALALALGPVPSGAQAPAPPPTPVPGPPAQTMPAQAPEPEKGPNTGRVSLGLGVDFPTDYYFRGILQEDTGTIMQPYGEINFKLLESDGPLSAIVLTPGLWNSWHWGPAPTMPSATSTGRSRPACRWRSSRRPSGRGRSRPR
jgi:hypothetical protein